MVTLYRLYRDKTGRFLKKIIPLNIIVLPALFSVQFAYAQSDSLQKQINEQVWKPFISTFNSGDDEGFKAVHSKDVIRVSQDSKQIITTNSHLLKQYNGYGYYYKRLSWCRIDCCLIRSPFKIPNCQQIQEYDFRKNYLTYSFQS